MNPAAQFPSKEKAAVLLRRPAGIILPALLLLAGLGGFLLLTRAQAVRSAEVASENLVQVIEAQVTGDLSRLESLLLYAAAEFDPERISQLPPEERRGLSQRLAQLLHDFPAAGGLNLFDSQGRLLLSDQADREPFSIADRPVRPRMIANFLQLLQMELEETMSDGQKEYVQFAVSGAKRLDAMLLGLLEYSRVGRTGEPSVWLESRAVLDEALLFLRPAAAEAGAAVRVAGDWPRLKASPDGLLRLLQNLIGNALKFCRPGCVPEVTVSGGLLPDRWRLTVTDKGIGLRTPTEYEGTGVGLAVARKIAEQHGGSIRAESPGEGLGSSFIVELPLAADES